MMSYSTSKTIIYLYKGKGYEVPPIKSYYIDMKEIKDDITYITIRRKIPSFIHGIIMGALLAPLLVSIYYVSISSNNIQIRNHTIRVPSEMYYDNRTGTLDIDISNDSSNFETISILIKDNEGNNIIELNGINPGESVGTLPVEIDNDKLPMRSTIVYKSNHGFYEFKSIKLNVLIVDRSIADKDINRDF